MAADVTFCSFGDSHYGVTPSGGMTNWVYLVNQITNSTYPSALGGGAVAPPRGVLAFGDLINDGANLSLGTTQWNTWKADYGVNGEGTCVYPVYETYGNHDLNSTRFVQKDIITRNLTRPGLTAISTNGLHYSWDWDGVHFVSLGIYPADTWVPENTYGSIHDPEYALSFLKWDLANNVGDSGRPVILMHHYDFLTGWWPTYQELDYSRALDGYNVVLILHGHQGAPYGYSWQGYSVSGQNGTLNVCHITTNNQILLAQITGTNTWGNTYSKSFTFPDLGLSWNGVPRNGDKNVQTNVTQLSWKRGAYVQSQDVYFGTSSNAVYSSTTPDIDGLAAGVTNVAIPAAFLPLQPGTDYFWRVDQTNGAKPFSKGRVWSFRTKDMVKTNDLTFLFVSDDHYEDNTLLANQRNVQAMNGIPGTAYPTGVGGVVQTPRGVMFGGDAANDANWWQYTFYTNDYGLTAEKLLQYPVAGECNGNHDGGLGSIVGDNIVARNRTRTGLTGISTNGLFISWDWDGIHFVTLGVRPGTNTNPYNSYGSLEFLQGDLPATVGSSGRPVVLIHHFGLDDYGMQWWTQDEWTRYYNVIKDYNVIGIFHGHTHVTEIYKWNNLDIFHPPHMQFGGTYADAAPVSSYQGFFTTHIVSNTMSVVERTAGGTWGMSLTKTFYRSYADSGLAAMVNTSTGAVNVTAITASLTGKLLYQAASPTAAYVYYDTADGGTNKAAWANVAAVGTVGLGGFAANVSGLMAGSTYYYQCYASNSMGSVWASIGSSFTTSPAAQVDNAGGATAVRMITATLNGTLAMTGAAPTSVYIFYGAADGGTNKSSWTNTLALGAQPLGAFSLAIAGLNGETTYYYRCYASNVLGGVFAGSSASFVTQPPVAVDNALGASDISDVSANLNGTLLITNAAPTLIYVYWGTSDGGTVRADWTHEVALGARELGSFSCVIGGLTPQTRYYYRCYGTNSAGARWAASTSVFDSSRDFTAWQNRMKITFKGYNRPEALANFPVLVALSETITNFHYSQFASTQGGDLRFATASNSELKFEVDEWNPGGTSYVWVQVPVLVDTNSYVWAYWGNPAETSFPAYTTNGATWSEGYAAVWHMSEPNALDSLNLNNGTSQGGASTPGLIGTCQSMPGWADHSVVINAVKTNLDITGPLSVGGWVYYASNAMAGVLTKGSTWGDYNLHTKGGTGNYLSFELKPFMADASTAPIGTTSLATGRWYHVYGTWDGTTAKVYVNGKAEASKTATNGVTQNTSRILKLGTINDRYLYGSLDEVSVANVGRSSNWVWACWMNQGSNSAFSSYLVATSAPPPAVVSQLNGASSVTATSATLNGNLSSPATSPTSVYVCWGNTDGGANAGSWQHAIPLGARLPGDFSTDISGLSVGTLYFYRCFASNSVGVAWAPAASAFTTLPAAEVSNSGGATGVTTNAATLNGFLVSMAVQPTAVWFYWGLTDGGTSKASWANQIALGTRPLGACSAVVSGLGSGLGYYYRTYASNSLGEAWAPASTSFVVPGSGAFSGWSHQMKITFQGYNRSETLTNFPALLAFQPGTAGFSYDQFASPTGGDLRFADALGNELPYEIDEWHTNASSYVWVRVPALVATNTYVLAYWGSSLSNVAPAYTTDGSTWANGYAAVWHMGETNAEDSLHRNNGISQGSTSTAGQLGIAQAFVQGYDNSVYVPAATSDLDLAGNLSLEAWVKPISRNNHFGIIVKGGGWGDYNLFVRSGGWHVSMELKPFLSGSGTAPDSVTSLQTNTWYYVHTTWDGALAKIYINGALETTKATNGTVQNLSHSLKMGTIETRYTAGQIDEATVSRVARSSNWIWACWMNTASNAQFCSYSSQAVVTSPFAFTDINYNAQAGTVVLKWQSEAGRVYTLEQATDLLHGVWQTVNSNLAATPPFNTYTTAPSASRSVFYRVFIP